MHCYLDGQFILNFIQIHANLYLDLSLIQICSVSRISISLNRKHIATSGPEGRGGGTWKGDTSKLLSFYFTSILEFCGKKTTIIL